MLTPEIEVLLDWVEENYRYMRRMDTHADPMAYVNALRTGKHVILASGEAYEGSTKSTVVHQVHKLCDMLPHNNKMVRELATKAINGQRTFSDEVIAFLTWAELNPTKMIKVRGEPPADMYIRAITQHSVVIWCTGRNAEYNEGKLSWRISSPCEYGLYGIELWKELLKLQQMVPPAHRNLINAAIDRTREDF